MIPSIVIHDTCWVDFVDRSTQDSALTNLIHSKGCDRDDLGIQRWFEAQVERTPNAIALVCDERSITYQSLNQQANQLAHFLIAQGLQPQERVIVSTGRSVQMVVAFLGVLKAGGAYVPIDPTYPIERRAYQIQDAQSRLILTQQQWVKSLPAHSATVICLDADWETIANFSNANLDLRVDPDQLAYVIYTSGSTGAPKGVMIPHRAVVNHSCAMTRTYEFTASDRVLQFASISFDITIEQLYPALFAGAAIVLRSEAAATSIRQFLSFVEQHQISVLILPVAFWHEWVNAMPTLQNAVPACVRLVAVGGEKPARQIYAQWRDRVGHYPRWLNGYGPTEATVTATVFDPIATNYDLEGEIPIGKPIANVEVHVLNSELQPVPVGECGELYIGGLGLAQGYLNLPDRTAEKFIANPFGRDRLYKTGDMVRVLPDGNLEFIGRIDFQVKLRGYRIELSEIEVCLEQYASIQQAIVLARSLKANQRLVAYLKLHSGESIDSHHLRNFLGQKLPEYMIPSAFVTLEQFPVTPNGKVDRRALPEPDWIESDSDSIAPTNAIEAKLVEIWQEILGVSPIGTGDNFFDWGGHSLLAARLLDQIAQAFAVELPLSILLQAPTIAQLATAIAQPNSDAPIVIRAGGSKPPIFFIHDGDGETLLYRTIAHQLDCDRPIYGIQPRSNADHPMLHTRIPDMAADYIDRIRAVQPQGPYHLAGLCAGGVLAYEIACQLQQAGQTVGMVALLDAAEPSLKRSDWIKQRRLDRLSQAMQDSSARSFRLLHQLRVVGQKAWNVLRYESSALIERKIDAVKARLFRYCLDRHQTPPAFLRLSVRKLYLFAAQDYAPTTQFAGKLLLVRATEGTSDADQPFQQIYGDPQLGWSARTTQGVCVCDVPGGHSSMLQTPHVQITAQVMQDYLDRL